jgi:transcriptional regulator with XRE-family HTH domain
LKLSQKAVAKAFGVGQQALCQWETNTRPIHERYLKAIVRFLGYEPRV